MFWAHNVKVDLLVSLSLISIENVYHVCTKNNQSSAILFY